MKNREMTASDIKTVLPLYVFYYNVQENGCWTEELAAKIHQVLNIEDSFSLILEKTTPRLDLQRKPFCANLSG